jgi:hypothetical protein
VTAVALALAQTFLRDYGFDLVWVADNILPFATAAILFSCLLSVYLYAASFSAPTVASTAADPSTRGGSAERLLAEGGNSGKWFYDFFIGRELNPRVRIPGFSVELDLKYFCELRPGLFLWGLINVAYCLKRFREFGSIDPGMGVMVGLQLFYIADSVFNEECILTTMDIIQDGFGFMLAFGDLAWVPFMYSLQARFFGETGVSTTTAWALGSLLAGLAGFFIFRGANEQKDMFRKDPNNASVRALKFLPTATGSRLLCDGYWGFARHVNYTGDWLLSLAQSLTTGFHTPITYFYPVYFAVLLIHREMRDEHKCAKKYGKDWEEYKRRVPYRFIKYIW